MENHTVRKRMNMVRLSYINLRDVSKVGTKYNCSLKDEGNSRHIVDMMLVFKIQVARLLEVL